REWRLQRHGASLYSVGYSDYAANCARVKGCGRPCGLSSVDGDHHVGRLDDGVRLLTRLKLELVDRFVGDRGCDDGPADIDADVRGRLALLHFDDLALDDVACAQLHASSPVGGLGVISGNGLTAVWFPRRPAARRVRARSHQPDRTGGRSRASRRGYRLETCLGTSRAPATAARSTG